MEEKRPRVGKLQTGVRRPVAPPDSGRTCPRCGAVFPAGAERCLSCGEPAEEGKEETDMKECPNCFHELADEETVCPNCGHVYGEPVGPTPREISAKRFKCVKRSVQVGMVLVMLAATLIGRYLGNWWWALLGFGLGLVAAFAVFYILGLAEWYTQVRPYENQTEEDGANGGDSRDSGEDQGPSGDE